jgi:micrococcal nuclease
VESGSHWKGERGAVPPPRLTSNAVITNEARQSYKSPQNETREKSVKRILIIFRALPAFIILISLSFTTSSFPDKGTVTAVYDGDTIKVRLSDGSEKRVRFIGLDTPEIDDPRQEIKFFAYMAKRFTFFYLYRKEIKLSYDWQFEDKYGRLLSYVWTEKQGLFNDFILRQGFAFAFLRYPFRKEYQEQFKEAENEARKMERGLWRKGDHPVVQAKDARQYLGQILAVKFICSKVEVERQFFFLRSSEGNFEALIPQENISSFPDIKSFQNKALAVTGFIEEYRGQVQIMVFFPLQINYK